MAQQGTTPAPRGMSFPILPVTEYEGIFDSAVANKTLESVLDLLGCCNLLPGARLQLYAMHFIACHLCQPDPGVLENHFD